MKATDCLIPPGREPLGDRIQPILYSILCWATSATQNVMKMHHTRPDNNFHYTQLQMFLFPGCNHRIAPLGGPRCFAYIGVFPGGHRSASAPPDEGIEQSPRHQRLWGSTARETNHATCPPPKASDAPQSGEPARGDRPQRALRCEARPSACPWSNRRTHVCHDHTNSTDLSEIIIRQRAQFPRSGKRLGELAVESELWRWV